MTEPTDKFGGDYAKAIEAYNALESKLGQQSTQIAELTTQVQTSNKTIQDLQTAQSQSTTDQGSGGSLYDWANGSMRTQDGQVDPNLLSSLEKAGASREIVESLVSTVETAQSIVQEQTASSINERFGNQQNFDAATTWAKDNLDQSKNTAINTLLGDRSTAALGLDMLKAAAAEGGLSFEEKKVEQVNEPGKLPENSGSGGGGLTPLQPHTQEAVDAMNEAFASGDPTKVAEYEQRLAAGQRAQ